MQARIDDDDVRSFRSIDQNRYKRRRRKKVGQSNSFRVRELDEMDRRVCLVKVIFDRGAEGQVCAGLVGEYPIDVEKVTPGDGITNEEHSSSHHT